MTPHGSILEVAQYDTQDGLYDCAWSEANENVLVASSGDGSIKVYDISLPPSTNPVRGYKEHQREVWSRGWKLGWLIGGDEVIIQS